MRAENCGKQFYEAKISLPEFLTIDDNRLQLIGVEFEYQRKRILHGLLKFHKQEFSRNSIHIFSKEQNLKLNPQHNQIGIRNFMIFITVCTSITRFMPATLNT